MKNALKNLCVALLVLALPAAAAYGQCTGLSLAGSASPLLFADGFESGGVTAWGTGEAGLPAFALTRTVDLVATVELGALDGEHVLELRFFAGEHLYQSIAVPVEGAARAAGATRRIPDYPFPVAIHSPGNGARRTAEGVLAVDVSLPVAGTLITQNALTGPWRVEVFLDGGEAACAPPYPFRFDP